jgi:3-phosphoshikimate 1-carboxyvinyltransferase
LSTLLVVGLGLIGGSFARAAGRQQVFDAVAGFDADPDRMRDALSLGVIDSVVERLDQPLDPVPDMIMLACPVQAMMAVMQALSAWLPADVIITDAGSVKGVVVEAWASVFVPGRRPVLVPGHPIAGSEKFGIEASREDLFEHHRVILTPVEGQSDQAVARVRRLWEGAGAQVLEMNVDHHDRVLAGTSHLPHVLAFTLVDSLAGDDESLEIFRYAAGGFRDFTRIAASDPVMWRDICMTNADAIIERMDTFAGQLARVREAIVAGDADCLMGVFTRAQAARAHFERLLEKRRFVEIPMHDTALTFITRKAPEALKGHIRVPGDKSISHRSIMLGSLAEGVTEITGFLEGEDALATLQAFRDMGVVIEGPDHGRVIVQGVGLHGLKAPDHELYMGNSGTSMRLVSGLMAAQRFSVTLTGDASLSRRPMRRVTDPLAAMGARIQAGEGGCPPVRVQPASGGLRGISYSMPVASAPVKSALLLAGLYAQGMTEVTEPAPTRDHTERMLRGFGYAVETEGSTIRLQGGGRLQATRIRVPGDISSSAFFLVAASIVPGSDLTIESLGMNPTRTGVIDILKLMGADIEVMAPREEGGEPVADVRVRYAPLRGIRIPEALVPLAIDEFPVLFVAAACARGETVLTGARELRVKESDRIQVMADGLAALGISADPTEDGIRILGGVMDSAEVESHGDHRIAMAFSVAGLRAEGRIVIRDCATVSTSFPGFADLARSVGFVIDEETGV